MHQLYPDFIPEKRGIKSGIKFGENSINVNFPPTIDEDDPEGALKCVYGLYKVFLDDSLLVNRHFYFFIHHNKEEKGVITLVNIAYLEPGEHILRIEKIKNRNGKTKEYPHVPFWKE
ncbi:MAG: hypothetical protein JXB49_06995 [Bacteroidales bacterium]|nr:hypothetical protein [Bacteroidales bacterium]